MRHTSPVTTGILRRTVSAVLTALTLAACGAVARTEARPTGQETRPAARPGDQQMATGSAVPVPPMHPSVDLYPAAGLRLVSPEGDREVSVAARVANTEGRREHGLMKVTDVPAGAGMLFFFPADTDSGFWMKDTLVPLDIAFFDRDGLYLTRMTMETCTSSPCKVYDPKATYRFALEVRAGWLNGVGLERGWRLEVPPGLPPAS